MIAREDLVLKDRLAQKIEQVLSSPRQEAIPAVEVGAERLAGMIDHTLLKPDATQEQIVTLCREAHEYRFATVCVNPVYVPLCRECLSETGVGVASVVGFPLGATLPEVKAYEAQRVIAAGATEADMVLQVGALKGQDYDLVYRDIAAVVQACHARGVLLKVIIEAALLTDEEKVAACYLTQLAGADFCKTSTGFGPSGAKVEDVVLMRQTVGPSMGIKAAGGIRTYQDTLAMIGAGATRIGASAGAKIVEEARAEG
jgi:deoxyribose-phosphate aldolase